MRWVFPLALVLAAWLIGSGWSIDAAAEQTVTPLPATQQHVQAIGRQGTEQHVQPIGVAGEQGVDTSGVGEQSAAGRFASTAGKVGLSVMAVGLSLGFTAASLMFF